MYTIRLFFLAILISISAISCKNGDILLLTIRGEPAVKYEIYAWLDEQKLHNGLPIEQLPTTDPLAIHIANAGSLRITMYGLSANGCRSSRGELTSAFSPSGLFPSQAEITLIPVVPHQCPLQVTVSGDGSVRSHPQDLICPSGRCTWYFPEPTPVALEATTGPTAYTTTFESMQPGCQGRSGCGFTLDRKTEVQVRFIKKVCTTPGWCVTPNLPTAVGNKNLRTIWGANPNNIWVAGEGGLILHYDGSSWSSAASPTTDNISALWGNAKKGFYGATAKSNLLGMQDSQWQILPESGQLTSQPLLALWGNDDGVLATGQVGSFLRHDGSKWTLLPSDSRLRTTTPNALWGSASNDVWAVGAGGLLAHFDGITWAPHAQSEQLTGSTLYGLTGSGPQDIWAVGTGGSRLHYDGIQWTKSPADGVAETLYAGWSISRTNAWAVGSNGTILQFNGAAWQKVASPVGAGSFLAALWGDNEWELWAVGNTGVLLTYQP